MEETSILVSKNPASSSNEFSKLDGEREKEREREREIKKYIKEEEFQAMNTKSWFDGFPSVSFILFPFLLFSIG